MFSINTAAAGYLFVDDAEVVHMVAAIAPIAALYQFPDGILGCIGGVLRGMGRQAYLMAFNLIGAMRLSFDFSVSICEMLPAV